MVYDPEQMSYEALLEQLSVWHTPRRSAGQYRSIVFFRTSEERALARAHNAHRAIEPELISTEEPGGRFWPAEDYHQKHQLRRESHIVGLLSDRYGARWDEHTLATKLNAAGSGVDVTPWIAQLPEPLRRFAG